MSITWQVEHWVMPHVQPDADNENYLRALCLQNLDQLNTVRLIAYVEHANRPKFRRA